MRGRYSQITGRRLFIVLGQGQVAPELLQMRGHDCPSEGLRPLWRVEPDLERDRDSRQHTTQHNDLERRHCPWAFGPRAPYFLERKNYARVSQRSAPLGEQGPRGKRRSGALHPC